MTEQRFVVISEEEDMFRIYDTQNDNFLNYEEILDILNEQEEIINLLQQRIILFEYYFDASERTVEYLEKQLSLFFKAKELNND